MKAAAAGTQRFNGLKYIRLRNDVSVLISLNLERQLERKILLRRDEDVQATKGVDYRLLEEVPNLSYGEKDTGNMLIQGDNLEA